MGFIRAQRGRARFFGEYYFIQHRQLFNLAQDISLAVNIFGDYEPAFEFEHEEQDWSPVNWLFLRMLVTIPLCLGYMKAHFLMIN